MGVPVSLILIAFLFEWRTAVISLTAIPLSIVAALLVLTRLGMTINTMVLAGLAIAVGEVVDDAIIDVENPERPRLDQMFNAGGAINDTRAVQIGSVNASQFALLADGRNGFRVVQLISPDTVPGGPPANAV